MQHLDDGIIHALLDGELSAAEAEALREHVQYCQACAERVAEEKLIQSEAERMIAELDAPGPAAADAAAPPMPAGDLPEPLLGVSPEGPMASGPPVVLMPERDFERSRLPRILGWAATLVVAAGAGYFASVARQSPVQSPISLPEIGVPDRGTSLLGTDSGPVAGDVGQAAAESVATSERARDGEADAAGFAAGAEAKAADAAPLVLEESESERPQPIVAAPPPAPVDDRAEERPREVSREGRREAEPPRVAARQDAQASSAIARDEAASAAPPPAQRAPASTAVAAAPGPSALEQQSQIRMRIGLDETQRMLGSALHVIDGLQQQFVGLVDGRLVQGANPSAPVVRVVYLDDRRRPIYLDQQRLDGARRQMGLARDTIPPDWVKGDVWLSLKGSMSPEELAALARRVR